MINNKMPPPRRGGSMRWIRMNNDNNIPGGKGFLKNIYLLWRDNPNPPIPRGEGAIIILPSGKALNDIYILFKGYITDTQWIEHWSL